MATEVANKPKTENKSVGLEEAVRIVEERGTRLVWLGIEPSGRIGRMLNVGSNRIMKMDPEELIYKDSENLKKLEGHIFLCYHGNTSKFMAEYLDKRHNVKTYHLKNGVVPLTGEVF